MLDGCEAASGKKCATFGTLCPPGPGLCDAASSLRSAGPSVGPFAGFPAANGERPGILPQLESRVRSASQENDVSAKLARFNFQRGLPSRGSCRIRLLQRNRALHGSVQTMVNSLCESRLSRRVGGWHMCCLTPGSPTVSQH